VEDIKKFIDSSSKIVLENGISTKQLRLIAAELGILANNKNYWFQSYLAAKENEELLYQIATDEKTGMALYLISDALGVVSPPHSHQTWAIIAGISGTELNHSYQVIDEKQKLVRKISSTMVKEGDVAILNEHEIHSTEVIGNIPTFHLHLYGRELKLLQKFSQRTYSVNE